MALREFACKREKCGATLLRVAAEESRPRFFRFDYVAVRCAEGLRAIVVQTGFYDEFSM
jgi:hypothetical protein